MKSREQIHNAIDESLSGVRFNVSDMRSVMRSIRSRQPQPAPARRRLRLDVVFVFSMIFLIALPAALFALRERSTHIITTIGPQESPAPNQDIVLPAATPQTTPEPTPSPTEAPTPKAPTLDEENAILAARACFEAQCDTTLFSFDEYTVSTSLAGGDSSRCVVTMRSIYDNGCLFTVVVSLENGQVLQYSAPRMATTPSHLDMQSEEVQAWYQKNGAHLFTWPLEAQAEFSRRYEGAALRMPKDDELSQEQAVQIAVAHAKDLLENSGLIHAYASLRSERASDSGGAHYVVYCFSEPVADELPASRVTVMLDAQTGEVLSVTR